MGFTNILFLLAGLAVIGPVLAHLWQRTRYRRIPFTMLRFLELSQKQTQSRRRLRDWLILLLRCTIVLLVAVLFAGPIYTKVIPKEATHQHHLLILDNSLSMTCTCDDIATWDRMEAAALSYLREADDPQAKFSLFATNSGPVGQQLTARAAEYEIKHLKPASGAAQIPILMTTLQQLDLQRGPHDSLHVHLITDGTRALLAALERQAQAVAVDGFSQTLVTPQVTINNVGIRDVTVQTSTPTDLTLSVQVTNYGSTPAQRMIQAQAQQNTSPSQRVEVEAGESVTVLLTLPRKQSPPHITSLPVLLQLSPEDDLAVDDHYRLGLSFTDTAAQRVLLVGDNAKQIFLLEKALQALDHRPGQVSAPLVTTTFEALHRNDLLQADVIIVSRIHARLASYRDELEALMNRGVRFICFSTGQHDADTAALLYASELLPARPRSQVTAIAHPGTLDLGSAGSLHTPAETRLLGVLTQYHLERIALWSYYRMQALPDTLALWPLQDEAALVYTAPTGTGRCTLINASIDDSSANLTKDAAILAFTRYLLGQRLPLSALRFRTDEAMGVPVADDVLKDTGRHCLLDRAGRRHPATRSGSCLVKSPPHALSWYHSPADPPTHVGVVLPPEESDLLRLPPEQVEKQLEALFPQRPEQSLRPTQAGALARDISLARWVVVLLIGLILLETTLANRMQR